MTWITSGFSWVEAKIRPPAPVTLSEWERLALRPPPKLSTSDWADARRILQAGTSRQPGPWKTATAPYLREIMEAYDRPEVRHIVVCAGTQLGKTEVIYNVLGKIIDLEPYSTLLVYPREDDAKTISRTRLQPMIQACPTLRSRIPAKADLFQTLEQHFPGMVLYLIGANSAAALANKPCRNILRDEIDKYPDLVGEDGDPLSLSEARAKTFWDMRKVFDVSSPTLDQRGIWKQLQTCDEIRDYEVACPFCGAAQVLKFPCLKWDSPTTSAEPGFIAPLSTRISHARATARYECRHCGAAIGDGHKPAMLAAGRWVAEKPAQHEVTRVGFRISSLYSPWLSWGDIAEAFLRADAAVKEGKTGAMRDFVNGWLAEPWIERVNEVKESQVLERRCQLPPLTVPAGAVALTAGIDTQKFGFWVTVWAWGANREKLLESWMIFHKFIDSWEMLSSLIFETAFPIAGSDRSMRIWRAGIDTGGTMVEEGWSRTEEVYQWLRGNGRGVVFGTKGRSRASVDNRVVSHSVIDKMPGGQAIPGGLVLWMLDTIQLKELFFWRLSSKDADPQPIHLHAETGEDFARQILAEEKRRDKNGNTYWERIRKDNHYLDASTIAHACAHDNWLGGIPLLARMGGWETPEPKPAGESDGQPEINKFTGRPVGSFWGGGRR